jgi:type VI protein secretion system component VasF
MNLIAPLAGFAALLAPGLAAFAHHPSRPAEDLPWWVVALAGAVALVALWLVSRVRQRTGNPRAAAQGGQPPNRFTDAA